MATADIYADLKRDHDKQREMLKELAELKGDGAKRKNSTPGSAVRAADLAGVQRSAA